MKALFIGLGNMGGPMAKNAARHHEIYGFDSSPCWRSDPSFAAVRSVEELNGLTVDIIVTMLPTTDVVRTVLREDGYLKYLSSGGTVIDMSSGSPEPYDEIVPLVREQGGQFVDAPVSGGVVGAQKATLTIMAGGSTAALESVEEFLLSMGEQVHHMGDVGSGQVAKLCNQVMVGVHLQALMEGMTLGKAAGLDLAKLQAVLQGGAASSWMLEHMGPRLIERDVSAGFRIDLQLKDLKIASDYAYSNRVVLPALGLVQSLFLEAAAHGEGSNGNQALFRVYERLNDQLF